MKVLVLCIVLCAASFSLGWFASPRHEDPDPVPGAADSGDVRAILAEGSRLARLNRLTELLDQLDAESLDAVLAVYDREITSMLGECEIQPLFEAWARFDPVSALAHADGWSLASKRRIALGAAVQGWALREPLSAKQAVEELIQDEPRLRQMWIEDLVIGWVHSGEPGALEYVVGLPENLRIQSSVALVGAQARRLDTAALLSWGDGALEQVGDDPQFQKEIFRRVARSVGRREPAELAAWAERHRGAGYAVDGASFAVEYWLPVDPDAAIEWISLNTPRDERDRVLRSAAVLWLKRSPAEASAWLEASPLDPASRRSILESARQRPAREPRGG